MRHGRCVWSYGITAVPQRLETTLPDTLRSLKKSGFDEPTIFFDGYFPNGFGYESIYSIVQKRIPIVIHPTICHLANWMTALLYIYTSNCQADRYALFEDDLLCVSNLREYLDSLVYPEMGYWNLLTHDENLLLTNKVEGWHKSNQKGRGALGLVFDRKAVQDLLTNRQFIERPLGNKQNADGMVMDTLRPMGYSEYIHYPSLLQHTGTVSAMGHHYGKVSGFKGEGYNPMERLKEESVNC